VTNTSAGLKSTSFTETDARYVRITGVTRAISQYGISFWEARVYGSADGSPPPPPPPGETPWGSSPVSLPGTIQGEEFNKGGEGVAYHDFDSANLGGAFRPTEGVDIGATADTGGGYNVGWIRAGEWMDYTVTVPAGGQYDIGFRWASGTTGGKVHVEYTGTNVTGTVNLGSTGGWQSWSTIWDYGVSLPAGTYQLRFMVDSSNGSTEIGNLNSIIVRNAVVPVTPKWPSSWTSKASSPTPRFEQFATVVGSKIFVFGGWNPNFKVVRSYASYDTATNTWTQLGDLPAGMAETHVGITNDGSRYIYMAGGFGGDLDTTKSPTQWISDRVYRYDTQDGSWTQIATLPQPRGAGALQLVNGQLHYFGGNPADRVSNVGDHYVYDLASGTWSTAALMPNPKDHFSTVVIGSKIYAVGGEYGHDTLHQQQPTAAVYDTTNDTWTTLANMPIAKSHTEAGTYVSAGKIVMAGGQVDNYQPTNNVISYDPLVDAWATLTPSLPVQRQGAVIQQVGSQVFLTLGGIQTNQPQSGTWVGQLP
jgi:N-acetylneuraminic acid mutarotase